jgi:hypothetical protein
MGYQHKEGLGNKKTLENSGIIPSHLFLGVQFVQHELWSLDLGNNAEKI